MTRDEAIAELRSMWLTADSQFLISKQERDESDRKWNEVCDALDFPDDCRA